MKKELTNEQTPNPEAESPAAEKADNASAEGKGKNKHKGKEPGSTPSPATPPPARDKGDKDKGGKDGSGAGDKARPAEPAEAKSETRPETNKAAAAAAPAAAPAAPRQTVGWWALLLALVAGGVAGWAVWQMQDLHGEGDELRQTLASRLADQDRQGTEVRTLARQQQDVIAQLQGKLGALEAKLENTEGQAAALDTMYREFSRARDSRVAAEVQQAITLAAQQLQLAGNVEAALVALNQADARLAAHDRGQFGPLRRALAHDIESLKMLQLVDVPGIGLRLERLLARVERLPLSFETELPEPEGSAPVVAADSEAEPAAREWYEEGLEMARRFSGELWEEVSNLVRLERLDRVDPMLLAPSQSTFLRENLKVRLLTARLALLSRDQRSYGADLEQAISMIERFFDADDALVRSTLDELTELKGISLERKLPSLTESFAALRMLQSDNDLTNAGTAAAATDEQ